MTKQLEITRYPVYTTYGKMGLSQDDIDTDTVYTIQKRLSSMSDAEKLALNITDEKLSSVNLFQMLENGDGFVELSSDITVKRLSKNNVVWEYIHYLGKSKKGNLNWVRYLSKDQFDLNFIKTKCQ